MKRRDYKKHTQEIRDWDSRLDSKNTKIKKRSKRRISKKARKYGIELFGNTEQVEEKKDEN